VICSNTALDVALIHILVPCWMPVNPLQCMENHVAWEDTQRREVEDAAYFLVQSVLVLWLPRSNMAWWSTLARPGWGAWSIESGWGQAWTAALLALREQGATVWDFTAKSRVRDYFPKLRAEMLPDGP
jgi:hypothetical protein